MDQSKERKQLTANFYADEFDCKCGCGLNNIQTLLVRYLQDIRDEIERPLTVTSGTRCVHHNAREGGTSTSDHLRGFAADTPCHNAIERRELVYAALKVGVPTIGVKKDCIHLSIGYPARVFTYD